MQESNQTFRKVGKVLLVLGVIDLAILLYCLATMHYYSSNLNLFAIVPGIFLFRSSVKAARLMRWLSVFVAVVALGFYAITQFSKPLDLILLQFKLNTNVTLIDFVAAIVVIAVLFWVYLQLSREESLQALAKAGFKTGKPVSAIIAGAVIVIAFAVGSYSVLTGEAAQKARAMAAERGGDGYRYYVSGISFDGEHVTAQVTAYNDEVMGIIEVSW